MPRGGRARPRARGRLLAFVLCCALLTAGCTHRSSRPGDPGGASAAPRVGGTLRIALVTPGSLDPAQATSAEWRLLVGNLFDSLTTLDPARTVRGIAAPDPATLQIDLSEAFADFPALVADPRLSPVPPNALAGGAAAFAAKPLGNGPFMLTKASKGQTLELVRNPHYSGHAPYLDRVRVQVVPDQQTAWLAFQHGQVSF